MTPIESARLEIARVDALIDAFGTRVLLRRYRASLELALADLELEACPMFKPRHVPHRDWLDDRAVKIHAVQTARSNLVMELPRT